jgi:hypothetical protein
MWPQSFFKIKNDCGHIYLTKSNQENVTKLQIKNKCGLDFKIKNDCGHIYLTKSNQENVTNF